MPSNLSILLEYQSLKLSRQNWKLGKLNLPMFFTDDGVFQLNAKAEFWVAFPPGVVSLIFTTPAALAGVTHVI